MSDGGVSSRGRGTHVIFILLEYSSPFHGLAGHR